MIFMVSTSQTVFYKEAKKAGMDFSFPLFLFSSFHLSFFPSFHLSFIPLKQITPCAAPSGALTCCRFVLLSQDALYSIAGGSIHRLRP